MSVCNFNLSKRYHNKIFKNWLNFHLLGIGILAGQNGPFKMKMKMKMKMYCLGEFYYKYR
jgi:hypothetical protein